MQNSKIIVIITLLGIGILLYGCGQTTVTTPSGGDSSTDMVLLNNIISTIEASFLNQDSAKLSPFMSSNSFASTPFRSVPLNRQDFLDWIKSGFGEISGGLTSLPIPKTAKVNQVYFYERTPTISGNIATLESDVIIGIGSFEVSSDEILKDVNVTYNLSNCRFIFSKSTGSWLISQISAPDGGLAITKVRGNNVDIEIIAIKSGIYNTNGAESAKPTLVTNIKYAPLVYSGPDWGTDFSTSEGSSDIEIQNLQNSDIIVFDDFTHKVRLGQLP